MSPITLRRLVELRDDPAVVARTRAVSEHAAALISPLSADEMFMDPRLRIRDVIAVSEAISLALYEAGRLDGARR